MPKTFICPDETVEAIAYMQSKSKGEGRKPTYIVKPAQGTQGMGIHLIQKFSDIPDLIKRDPYIIQEYIEHPMLLENKKFDL